MAKAGEPVKDPLPRHIEDAVRQVSAINRAHHSEARPSERLTDGAVAIIGTPTFIGLLLAFAAVWIGLNTLWLDHPFDPPPFHILEMVASLTAILLAVLILAAQRRDDRLATRREQMTLQVALLSEQKISKVIELVEELRRDLPNVSNRVDLDALEMTAGADHEEVLKTVEEHSDPATKKPRE